MKHIESSMRIATGHPVEASAVKYSLLQRLRAAFHVETVGEGIENFSVNATSKATSYVFNLNVSIKSDGGRVRVMVDGSNEISMATKVFYVLSLLAVLALSLFPGAMDDGTAGMALEAIFFLVVGGFIIYDTNKKMEEPQQLLDRILTSLGAEFG